MSTLFKHPNGAYSLILPNDWGYEFKKSTVAFFQNRTGVGALNISSMIPPTNEIDPTQVATDFVPKEIRSQTVVTNLKADIPNAVASYVIGDTSWRVWVLCGKTRVIVVSYNCQRDYMGIEDENVDKIIQSLVVS